MDCALDSTKYLTENLNVEEYFSYEWTIPDFHSHLWFTGDQLMSPKFITGDQDGLVWKLILRWETNWKLTVQVYLEKSSDHYENVRFDVCYVNKHDHEVCFDFDKTVEAGPYQSNTILQSKTYDYRDIMDKILNETLTIKFKVYSGDDCTASESYPKSAIWDFENFEKLLGDENFSDVKLVVGDQEFTAHKNILSARSPVFLDMFTKGTKKTENPWVEEVLDVHPKVMQEFLRFLYTGKICDFKSLKIGLLIAADKYKVKKLFELCEEAIIDDLGVENIGDALLLADCYDVNKLKSEIIKQFKTHGSKIVKTERFKAVRDFLSVKTLNELLEKVL